MREAVRCLPVYNEEESIPTLIAEIHKALRPALVTRLSWWMMVRETAVLTF